jgi:hypothetical protein
MPLAGRGAGNARRLELRWGFVKSVLLPAQDLVFADLRSASASLRS